MLYLRLPSGETTETTKSSDYSDKNLFMSALELFLNVKDKLKAGDRVAFEENQGKTISVLKTYRVIEMDGKLYLIV